MEFRVQEVFRFHRFVPTMWLASFFSQFLPNRNLHNSTLWGEEISCDYPAVWKSSFNLKARESDKLHNESLLSTHGSQGVDPFPSTRWQRRLLKASPLTSAPSGCYDLMVCMFTEQINSHISNYSSHILPVLLHWSILLFCAMCQRLRRFSFITQIRENRFHRNPAPY